MGLLLLPGGGIQVAAAAGSDGMTERAQLLRLTAGGVPDASFGEGRRLELPLGRGGSSRLYAAALQADGRTLLAGRTWERAGWLRLRRRALGVASRRRARAPPPARAMWLADRTHFAAQRKSATLPDYRRCERIRPPLVPKRAGPGVSPRSDARPAICIENADGA
jgi:hypothetical protein